MGQFKFRLQRVLEVRQLEEQEALNLLTEARNARRAGEDAIEHVVQHRNDILRQPITSLEEHRLLESYVEKCDQAEREGKIALEILLNEEQAAEARWFGRKRDLEALLKLREHALEEWHLEENRREQSELDEWTTMRRSA